MSMRHVPALILLAAAAVLSACDRGGPREPAPEASPTETSGLGRETATAGPSGSATPSIPAPAPGSIEIASVVRLVDVRTGAVLTLFESREQRAFAAFEGDEVVVSVATEVQRYRLDGSRAPEVQRSLTCMNRNGDAEIGGRRYGGVQCGSISPDGGHMVYLVQTGEVTVGGSGYRVPQHDMRMLDIGSGTTTRLQSGLVHCGGCDARYGPRWSPTSRYVAYAESGGEGRRFLTDRTTAATRVIGRGNEVNDAPEWSPSADVIVYPPTPHGTAARIENLANGTARDLDIAWPLRFDATGTYLYSPAWAAQPKQGPSSLTTTIVEVQTGRIAGTVAGAPPQDFLWTGTRAVTRFGASQGYLAVLQGASDCNGTAIYGQGVPQPICVRGGVQGLSSQDGFRVAVARQAGEVGPVHGPGFSSMSLPRFDVEVVNMVGGGSRTVASGIVSFAAPSMVWNEAGTHLLLVWPHSVGL